MKLFPVENCHTIDRSVFNRPIFVPLLKELDMASNFSAFSCDELQCIPFAKVNTPTL